MSPQKLRSSGVYKTTPFKDEFGACSIIVPRGTAVDLAIHLVFWPRQESRLDGRGTGQNCGRASVTLSVQVLQLT